MNLEETAWQILIYAGIGIGVTWYFRKEIEDLVKVLLKIKRKLTK